MAKSAKSPVKIKTKLKFSTRKVIKRSRALKAGKGV